MAKTARALKVQGESIERFVDRCSACLAILYAQALEDSEDGEPAPAYQHSLKYLLKLIAVLIAAQRIPERRNVSEPLRAASRAVFEAAQGASAAAMDYETAVLDAWRTANLGIFEPTAPEPTPHMLTKAAAALLAPRPDATIEPIYFATMPLSWLGRAYQHMLSFRPSKEGNALELNRAARKGRGVYFTPPSLVTYIIEGVLTPLVESACGSLSGESMCSRLADLKVLDPAMGGGDFLIRAAEFMGESAVFGKDDSPGQVRAQIAANCVYGVDVDPLAVEIARFGVWAASGFADGITSDINNHLLCADALRVSGRDDGFGWRDLFPEVYAKPTNPGFDAVVGNPPYIAAKNGLGGRRAGVGQSDYYLMFFSAALDGDLVADRGMLSMVLPDPMLVRENAAQVRRKLMTDWTLVSLLHISDAFPDAYVANVVPICRKTAPSSPTFLASRIERAGDRRSFNLRPRKTAMELAWPVRREVVLAQDRCDFLYLLEQGPFKDIIRRIHGNDVALGRYLPPFAPLRSLNAKSIYRGEEVGKSAIRLESGDLPMLLGGQSVQPYELRWEGCGMNRSQIKKPLERYLSTKILIQKSSARVIAALDLVDRKHKGYVFPQSVYAVELHETGMHPLYLLCILNSEVMNSYIWRTVTGYKLLQPQLELEDIRRLPIRRIQFTTPRSERERELARGISLFNDESLRAGGEAPFPELANFVTACLSGSPERSDIVHDLLVYLGRLMTDLTRANRTAPDAETTRKLETTRSAIETVVWRLYSGQPEQMELPW